MSDDDVPVAIPTQTIGPFFHVGPGATDRLGRMAASGVRGDHIELRIRVLDGDGAPVPDALVELWQADTDGNYSPPDPNAPPPAFPGFGRLGTDADGWCVFGTIRPGAATGADGARQAPHVNVCVHARGLLRHLYTRIYFEGEAALDADPLLSLVPVDRRPTLLARPAAERAWEFTIRLQGGDETVFFDL